MPLPTVFSMTTSGGSYATLDDRGGHDDGRRNERVSAVGSHRATGDFVPPNLGCQARTGGLAVPPGETTGSANLSDELSRSRGVICAPPEVDPGISAQPKGGGVTPVIPPPGSPGGDPSIVPK
jgi:hypothetical protein